MLRGILLMLVMLTTSMVAKSVIIEWPFFTKKTPYATRIERELDGQQVFVRFKGRCRITLVMRFMWLLNYDVVDRVVIQACLMNAGGGTAKGSQPSWM